MSDDIPAEKYEQKWERAQDEDGLGILVVSKFRSPHRKTTDESEQEVSLTFLLRKSQNRCRATSSKSRRFGGPKRIRGGRRRRCLIFFKENSLLSIWDDRVSIKNWLQRTSAWRPTYLPTRTFQEFSTVYRDRLKSVLQVWWILLLLLLTTSALTFLQHSRNLEHWL